MTRRFAVAWLLALLTIPATAPGQLTCRPNIFGGQDCEGPEGRSSSRPNIFGGFDTEGPGGARSTSQPNIFDGEDTRTRAGTIQSQPNIRATGMPERFAFLTAGASGVARRVTAHRGVRAGPR